MAHFAQIDNDNVVLRVIVAEQDFIDSGAVGDPASWIQTSYATREGVHDKGGEALRKNYAGIGFIYDRNLDAFIPPKEFDSWGLNEQTGKWEPPVESPKDGKPYTWDEAAQEWKESTDEMKP